MLRTAIGQVTVTVWEDRQLRMLMRGEYEANARRIRRSWGCIQCVALCDAIHLAEPFAAAYIKTCIETCIKTDVCVLSGTLALFRLCPSPCLSNLVSLFMNHRAHSPVRSVFPPCHFSDSWKNVDLVSNLNLINFLNFHGLASVIGQCHTKWLPIIGGDANWENGTIQMVQVL